MRNGPHGGLPAAAKSPRAPEAHNIHIGETFRGQVLLDGGSFARCRFLGATLIYEGGVPPRIEGCAFENVSFQFGAAAGRTLAFLQAMASPASGLRGLFKASFPSLFGH